MGMSCGRPFFDLGFLVPSTSVDTSMGMLRSLSLMLSCRDPIKHFNEGNYLWGKKSKHKKKIIIIILAVNAHQFKILTKFCAKDVLNLPI